MDKFLTTLLSFWNDITRTDKEKGATAVEYGLMVSLIAVAIIATVTAVGVALNGLFTTVEGAL
ncbi:Flp family type IVb pilin [Sinomonas halotolerans]|uniref:Flp family type IVb pilin n=1 Tax=Sinomonas halotolerans TaxID=1644133 RepID=A0ABU9X066_9MICC